MARNLSILGVLSLATMLLSAGCGEPGRAETGRNNTARAGQIDTTFLKDFAETRGFSSGQPSGVELTPDGSTIVFLRSGPRDVIRNLYEMNPGTGDVRGLLRAEEILKGGQEQLTPEEKARRERMRVSAKGFTWCNLSEDGTQLLVGLSGKLYVIRRSDIHVTALPDSPAGPAMDARFSPNGRYVSCIRGNDLYVIEIATGQERALTTGGTEDVPHGVAEFVAQEEMDRHTGYWWSSDSNSIAYQETDQRDVEKLFISDARSPEAKPQGWKYPRAGKTNAKVRLGIVPVTGGQTTWVEWDHEKYPYMAAVHWEREEPLTVYVQNRKQQEAVLYRVEPASGKCTELLRESDPAWVNIDAGMPKWLKGQNEFLWTSERSGQRELELRRSDGKLEKQLPHGARIFFGVVAVDQGRREIVVQAADTPTESHLYRIGIDRGDAVALTDGKGHHSGRFAKNGDTWVESVSLKDGSVRQVLRGRDASIRAELPSVAEDPPFMPNAELTTVETPARTMNAVIIRPRSFTPAKRYPVIVSVYGGPHSNMVSAAARGYLRQQWMADQGFIVVSLDGRGTMHRGRDWERAIYKDLIGPALEDQAAGLQALGARYKELDLTRVGITGWSFGGYFSAMAVLMRPDVYHCGVAGAPVTDWLDYDTHYTERYMSLPDDNADGYKRCAASTYAADLQRPLMLIHGTTDDNVYFTHTIKLTEALFRAGRPYDLMILPGFTHMVPEPIVNVRLYSRIVEYFKQHLVDSRPVPIAAAPRR